MVRLSLHIDGSAPGSGLTTQALTGLTLVGRLREMSGGRKMVARRGRSEGGDRGRTLRYARRILWLMHFAPSKALAELIFSDSSKGPITICR